MSDPRMNEEVASASPRDAAGSEAQKPSRYAIKTVFGAGLGYAFENYDNYILGFALAGITLTFGLTAPQAGALSTITSIGALLGGFAFGILSDYFGRIKVMTWSIVICGVATALIGFSQNYWQFAILRFISGVGIGGEYGVGMALVSETWPKSLRGRASSFVALGGKAGLVLALGVSTVVLATTDNWRIIFFIGVFPALLAFWYRLNLKEPEQYLKTKAMRTRAPIGLLFASPRALRASIGIIILTSVQNFGYYGIITFLPSYLSTDLGYSVTETGAWTGVTIVGFGIGMVTFGFLFDRVGKKISFVIFMVGAVVSLLIYSQLQDPIALLVGGGVMGIFVNGMLGGYGAITTSMFGDSGALGTAQSVLYNIGRGIGAFGPLTVGFFVESTSFSVAIAFLGLIYILDIIAVLFIIPRVDQFRK